MPRPLGFLESIKRRKKSFFILALVTFSVGLLTLTRTPVMTLHRAKDSDFKPVPYTRLAQCERKPRGEIDCPDIRRKGTTRLRQAQLVLTRMLRGFFLNDNIGKFIT